MKTNNPNKKPAYVWLVALLVLLSGSYVHAQGSYDEVINKFYETYKKDPLSAYENLFVNNKWIDKSSVQKNKIDFGDFLDDLGAYHGYELVTKKELGKSYLLFSFLVKHERQPYRIRLTFYKPQAEWALQNFSYDTKFDEELEDAAKYDRIPASK